MDGFFIGELLIIDDGIIGTSVIAIAAGEDTTFAVVIVTVDAVADEADVVVVVVVVAVVVLIGIRTVEEDEIDATVDWGFTGLIEFIVVVEGISGLAVATDCTDIGVERVSVFSKFTFQPLLDVLGIVTGFGVLTIVGVDIDVTVDLGTLFCDLLLLFNIELFKLFAKLNDVVILLFGLIM